MNISRRDVLKLAGGSILGVLFTPLPYKLLDDTAIWTQNWSLTPTLPRGPISYKYSACTLCPGGCALNARCVNGHPVSFTGVKDHPVNKGILCPIGLAGHHLAYHPLRLSSSCKFSGKKKNSKLVPASLDEIIAALSPTLKGLASRNTAGAIAILDQRPGRSISNLYKEFLSKFPTSYYVLPPSQEHSTLATIQTLAQEKLGPLGFDFENTKTILCFGAPLLDGWGTPGRMMSLFNNRRQTGLKLIQVESRQSRTALQANTWLPVKPGTEAEFALGIANVILHERLYPAHAEKNLVDFASYKKLLSGFPPELVAKETGLSTETIIETARNIAASSSIILAGSDPAGGPFNTVTETAIAGLNLLLGNVGKQGGIILRKDIPDEHNATIMPQSLADVPDHSVRLLIIDSAESGYTFPSSLLERKLIPDGGLIVSLSPYLSHRSALADYLIPAPAHLESLEEVITPGGASSASLSLSAPLIPKREKTVEPIEFVRKLAAAAGISGLDITTTEDLLKQRVRAMHGSQRGSLFSPVDGNTTSVTNTSSPDEMWTALTNGSCWIDNPTVQQSKTKFSLLGSFSELQFAVLTEPKDSTPNSLVLMPIGWKAATTSGALSPIMSKLFQESDVRNVAGHAFLNPITAVAHGVVDGEPVSVQTQKGMMDVIIKTDSAVMPDVLHVAVGPSPNKSETVEHLNGEGILALCNVQDDGTWRLTEATLMNAKA